VREDGGQPRISNALTMNPARSPDTRRPTLAVRAPLAGLVVALVIFSTGCLHHNAKTAQNFPPHAGINPTPAAPNAPIVQGEEGVASWYGRPFDGRRAASGEIFSMYDMTAAHRTLPFGTQVKVHDLENGRDVTVRINDRGPFVEGRIIDLSYAAAQAMGMNGIARVQLEILGVSPDSGAGAGGGVGVGAGPITGGVAGTVPVTIDESGVFAVQVGAFSDVNNANRFKALIEQSFTPVTVVSFDSGNGIFYRVRVGHESSEAGADALADKLRSANLATITFVVRIN
jgi:rare lipoprotein A